MEINDAAPESASLQPVDVLPPGTPGGPGEDVVPTSHPPREPGKQPWQLRRGVERQRVRGYETRRQLIELHVHQGKSLKECARLMGRHYVALHRVWRLVVAECGGERVASEDHIKAVRAYSDQHLRRVIEQAQGLVGEAAAYGAVVVAGVKALCELHGVKPEEAQAGTVASLGEIGLNVRVTSPLLLAKLERVRSAKEAAQSVGFSVREGGQPLQKNGVSDKVEI
jgi:transposase-like protein